MVILRHLQKHHPKAGLSAVYMEKEEEHEGKVNHLKRNVSKNAKHKNVNRLISVNILKGVNHSSTSDHNNYKCKYISSYLHHI
jgi:hypothetical protein